MGGDWTYGLFGCFGNCGMCLQTYFCPCILAGHNAEDTGQGSCCLCGAAFFVYCLGWWFVAQSRTKTREMRGIDGSFCMDLVYSLFCPCCVIIQTARELKEAPGAQNMHRS